MTATPQRRGRRRPVRWLAAAIFLLAATAGVFVHSAGWDQSYYLAQVSSVIEDRDLDLRNDFLHLGNDPSETRRMLVSTLPDGTLLNTFTVGPALFWSPAYLTGLAARGFVDGPAGAETPRWTAIQFAALHLLSLLLLLYVLWFFARWLRRAGAPDDLVPLCAVALVVGSPLLIYGFVSYTMTHLLSAAAACWFLAAVLDFDRQPTLGRAVACGAALGLVFLARWQGISIALALILPFSRLLRAPVQWRRALGLAAGLAASGFLVATLQLRVWHIELGRWITIPQGDGYMHWAHPEWFRFLFSGLSGLFTWSPLFAVGLVGLVLPWRLRLSTGWRWVALAALFFDIYLNAAVRDWWGGSSYGARRMTADLPWIALGLANVTLSAPSGSRKRWLAAGLTVICAYGFFTANLHRHGVQDLGLVFTGTPSDAPGTERDSGVVRDPAAARTIALGFPIRFTRTDYFSSPGRVTNGGRVASLGIVLVALIAGAIFLRRMPPAPTLRALMWTSLAAVALLQIWLSFGERPDPGERRRWQALVQELVAAQSSDRPYRQVRDQDSNPTLSATAGDAYRYLAGFLEFAGGRGPEATTIFTSLAARGYPPAQEMLRLAKRSDGSTLVRLIPGSFVDPREGAASSRLPLPAGHARIEFDLFLRELAPGGRAPVLALMAHAARIVSVGIEADGTLWMQAENGPPSQARGMLANRVYPLALDWDPASGLATLSTRGPAERPLELQVRARPSAGRRAISVRFGRPRGLSAADLTGPAFTDLRVVTFAAPDS